MVTHPECLQSIKVLCHYSISHSLSLVCAPTPAEPGSACLAPRLQGQRNGLSDQFLQLSIVGVCHLQW